MISNGRNDRREQKINDIINLPHFLARNTREGEESVKFKQRDREKSALESNIVQEIHGDCKGQGQKLLTGEIPQAFAP